MNAENTLHDKIVYSDIESLLRYYVEFYYFKDEFSAIINNLINPKHYLKTTNELLNNIDCYPGRYQEQLGKWLFIKDISDSNLIFRTTKYSHIDDVLFYTDLKNFISYEYSKNDYFFELSNGFDGMNYHNVYELIVIHFLEVKNESGVFNIDILYKYLYNTIFENTFKTNLSNKYYLSLFHQVSKKLLNKIDKYTSNNNSNYYYQKYSNQIGNYILIREDGIPFTQDELNKLKYDSKQIIDVYDKSEIKKVIMSFKNQAKEIANPDEILFPGIDNVFELAIIEYLNK